MLLPVFWKNINPLKTGINNQPLFPCLPVVMPPAGLCRPLVFYGNDLPESIPAVSDIRLTRRVCLFLKTQSPLKTEVNKRVVCAGGNAGRGSGKQSQQHQIDACSQYSPVFADVQHIL